MTLALFDLDNTLIAGDSDHAWGDFLVSQGVVDAAEYAEANDRFYLEYQQGCLDIQAYLQFALRPLARLPRARLEDLRREFMRTCIEPRMLPRARALLEGHRAAGDTLVIITATNRFVTEPIAAALEVPHLIATEPREEQEAFTGAVAGTPCFREGKITRLHQWLEGRQESLQDSCFYSDSHNDLPLLEAVSEAIAVDPDPRLREVAETRGWRILSLRDGIAPSD